MLIRQESGPLGWDSVCADQRYCDSAYQMPRVSARHARHWPRLPRPIPVEWNGRCRRPRPCNCTNSRNKDRSLQRPR